METVRPPARTRWVRLGLAAAGVALGWAAATTVTGWGATASHAADGDDASLLGAVVGTATEVADVLPEVAKEHVVAVVDKVEKTASTAARSVGKTVTAVTATKPVKKAADTVTRTVKKVPVVREVADSTGVTDTVRSVGDATTDAVTGVTETVDAVVDAVVPASPDSGILPPPSPGAEPGVPPIPPASTDTVVDDADDTRATSAFPPTAEVHASASLRQTVDAAPGVSTAAAGKSSAPQVRPSAPLGPRGPLGLPGIPGLPDGPAAMAVATGGAPSPVQGSSAVLSPAPASAALAWLRADRHLGEALPACPVFPTDTSPD